MEFLIMDANAGGGIIARIDTNNGKNALRIFRRQLLSAGVHEILRGRFNWYMQSSYGGAWYALPAEREESENA